HLRKCSVLVCCLEHKFICSRALPTTDIIYTVSRLEYPMFNSMKKCSIPVCSLDYKYICTRSLAIPDIKYTIHQKREKRPAAVTSSHSSSCSPKLFGEHFSTVPTKREEIVPSTDALLPGTKKYWRQKWNKEKLPLKKRIYTPGSETRASILRVPPQDFMEANSLRKAEEAEKVRKQGERDLVKWKQYIARCKRGN
ncbi:unnamed protein product, partial [Owenia fusiformis]